MTQYKLAIYNHICVVYYTLCPYLHLSTIDTTLQYTVLYTALRCPQTMSFKSKCVKSHLWSRGQQTCSSEQYLAVTMIISTCIYLHTYIMHTYMMGLPASDTSYHRFPTMLSSFTTRFRRATELQEQKLALTSEA